MHDERFNPDDVDPASEHDVDKAAADPESAEPVGYGNPPTHTRFKKGQSGNLKGRPKGGRNQGQRKGLQKFDALLEEQLGRIITVQERGRPIQKTVLETIMQTSSIKAMKGHGPSARFFMGWKQKIDAKRQADHEMTLAAVMNYKADCERDIRQRLLEGQPSIHYYPHPDDIKLDYLKGTYRIIGPFFEHHAEEWRKIDRDLTIEHEYADCIKKMTKELETSEEASERDEITADIADMEHILKCAKFRQRSADPEDKRWRMRRIGLIKD